MADLLAALTSCGWRPEQCMGRVDAYKGDLRVSFTAADLCFGVWLEPAQKFLALVRSGSEVHQVLANLEATPTHAEQPA